MSPCGKPATVLCAFPSQSERGTYARDAVQRTLEAQRAGVVLSTTIALQRSSDRTSTVDPSAAGIVECALRSLRSACAP
jgi:hypothetical protein